MQLSPWPSCHRRVSGLVQESVSLFESLLNIIMRYQSHLQGRNESPIDNDLQGRSESLIDSDAKDHVSDETILDVSDETILVSLKKQLQTIQRHLYLNYQVEEPNFKKLDITQMVQLENQLEGTLDKIKSQRWYPDCKSYMAVPLEKGCFGSIYANVDFSLSNLTKGLNALLGVRVKIAALSPTLIFVFKPFTKFYPSFKSGKFGNGLLVDGLPQTPKSCTLPSCQSAERCLRTLPSCVDKNLIIRASQNSSKFG
ncbi:MADS-box transcription factor 8-like [Cucumis melo var. makuwa]|uniref:MADS-box transcription factor 8-like n=1 Tax=Cucumis melo var. makuwa TaxID=1194695 RepID=A0A5A7T9V4_CUCMM|nr:MADS-box transcription factor 8-like [Cucumis melo var. makuwa]